MTKDADTRITFKSRKSKTADSKNGHRRQNQTEQDTQSRSSSKLRKKNHPPKASRTKLETRTT